MDYPKNDSEIRIWCLEMTMSSDFDFEPKRFPNIEKAQELYNFICPSSSKQEEQKN